MGITNSDGALYWATGIDNTGLRKGATEAKGLLQTLSRNITGMDVFAGLGVSAGLAFAKAGKEAFQFSVDYESVMTEVGTISDEVFGKFDYYSDQILTLATKGSQGPEELAKSMYQIVSAGYDGEKGLKILETATRSSTAGFVDTAVAADGITTVLNAWGKSFKEADAVSDGFFKTVERGKTTLPELASNIAQVAPIAASLNIPFEEIMGSMATITKQGTPTAQAFTQIRSAIVGISKEYGTAAFQGRSLQETFKAVAKDSGGQIDALTDNVKRSEAAMAILATTGEKAAMAMDDLNVIMNEAAGATEKAALKVEASGKDIIGRLRNNIIAAMKPLGDGILEEFSGIAAALNEAFADGTVNEFFEDFSKVLKISAALMLIFNASTIATTSSLLIQEGALRVLIARETILNRWQKLVTIGQKAYAAANTTSATTVYGLNAAMRGLWVTLGANPLTSLIAVLGLATAAYFAFRKNTDSAKIAHEEMTKNLYAEQKALNESFHKVREAKDGTNERRKAIEQINEKYRPYLDNLLTEKSTAEEIAKAYDKITTSIKNAQLEKAKAAYLDEPTESIKEANKAFYDRLNNFSKELSSEKQKGRFHSYILQLTEAVKQGGGFNMRDVETAFSAAQTEKKYETIQDYLKAVREREEDFLITGSAVLGKVGSIDYGNLDAAGEALDRYSKQLIKAKADYKEFAIGYIDTPEDEDNGDGKNGNTNPIPTKTPFDLKKYKEELDSYGKAYAEYNVAKQQLGQEFADKEYSELLKQGKDYREFLNNQLEKYQENANAKIAIAQTATSSNNILSQEIEIKPMASKGLEGMEKQSRSSIKKQIQELSKGLNITDVGVLGMISKIAEEQKKKLDDLNKYKSLQIKKLGIEEEKKNSETYIKKIKLIEDEYRTSKQKILKLSEESLNSIPQDLLKESFANLELSFENLDTATLGQLERIKAKLKEVNVDKEQLLDLGLDSSQVNEVVKTLERLKKEATLNVNTAEAKEIGKMFGGVGDAMSKASDEMTSAIGEMVSQLGNTIAILGDSQSSSLSKASGIISLAIAGGKELAKIREDESQKEVNEQREITSGLANQISMEMKLNQIRRERAEIERNSSPFLDPTYIEEATAAIEKQTESTKTLDDAMEALATNGIFTSKGKAKRRLFGSKSVTSDFSINQILQGYNVTQVDDASGFEAMMGGRAPKAIKNGGSAKDIAGAFMDPLGLFGGYADSKAQQNALDNLRKSFDSTLQEMGKTSTDMAKFSSTEWLDFFILMEEGGKITDSATKELLDTAQVAMQEYNDSMQELESVIADMAGMLGNDLSNSLVEAFQNGEDALENFKNKVNDVLNNMFMSTLTNSLFADQFKDLEKTMKASMDVGGDLDWADDIIEFTKGLEGSMDQAMEAMEVYEEAMEKIGYQGLKTEGEESADDSTLSGGIRREITEDTASELVGLWNRTAMDTREGVNLARASLEIQNEIAANTLRAANNTDRLETIESELKELNYNMSSFSGSSKRDSGF